MPCGENVDLCFYGDDMAFQDGPMMSMDLYRKMIKPHHRRLFGYIKSRSKAKIVYHTCGSVVHLIPDLIEMGVDALNPVQVSAKGMDTKALKREFGKDICFWGAIDTQRALPFGTPEDVTAEVKRRIEDLAPGGGYVLVCGAQHPGRRHAREHLRHVRRGAGIRAGVTRDRGPQSPQGAQGESGPGGIHPMNSCVSWA